MKNRENTSDLGPIRLLPFGRCCKTDITQALFEYFSHQIDVDNAKRHTNTKGPRDRWGRM